MKRKLIAILTAFTLVLFCIPCSAFAAETVKYSVSAPTSAVKIGNEFDVKISLTDYASMTAGIQGIQIDITNIDSNILEVVSHSALAVDSGAASNKTSYSSASKYVRYVYLNMSGTMVKTVTDLMTVRFKIKSTLTQDGSITLPVKLKIGTKTDSQTDSITLNDNIVINYTNSSDTVSVDVSWGSMEFVYDDGTWDKVSHKWLGSGWKPASENANAITVKNNGSSDVKAAFSYTPESGYESISGTFCDSNKSVVSEPVKIAKGGTASIYYLNLSGVTEERQTDSFVKVGTATLTLTE